ncbi:MAG: hypothetical protein ABEJ65_11245 [bacterium]
MQSKNILRWGIGATLLVLTLLFVAGLLTSSASPSLYVIRSSGGSVLRSKTVLLPGQSIESMGDIEVLEAPLNVQTRAGDVRFQFKSGTHVQILRVQQISQANREITRVVLDHDRGSGVVHVDSGKVIHYFPGGSVQQTSGVMSWTLHNDSGVIQVRNRSDIHVVGNRLVNISVQETRLKQVPELKSPIPPPVEYQSGTLESLNSVRRRINRFSRKHKKPGSIREVFGYWVRDRWGNPYLYRPRKSRFVLRSSGPDGVMFTRDDRRRVIRWSD